MRNLLLLAFLLGLTNLAKSTNYYLSASTGDDSRTNLQAQNPSSPWKTLDKLNSINLSLRPGDSIFFKRGDVFYGSLVVRSSGNSASRIYYGAYGTGSNPLISGFSTLSNWTHSSGNIYYTPLDVPALNMVTINGEAKGMGRYPNTGFLKYESNSGNTSITDNELPASPSWTGGEIVVRKYRFILDRHTITAHSGTTLSYSISSTNGNNAAFSPVRNNGYFIQNHLGTLDQFGEWYYDPRAKRLYMHFGGGSPSSYTIKASTKDYNAFVSTANFLVFENLNFEGGNTKGFFMTTTSNTLVKNCNFSNQGGHSFDAQDVSWITLQGGTVNTSFSNGVFFEHNANNCTVDGVEVNNTNMIPGTQRSGTGISVGITVNGNGSRIINNRVYRSGYNGISFLGDNVLIEKNYVDTYCTLKDDGGGIYTYIGEANTTSYNRKIRNNIIVNAVGAYSGAESYYYEAFGKAAGIYLDEHVNNVEVSGNVVANGDWGGIFLHNAHRNVISNNIFYNHRYQVLVSQYTAMTRNNTMTNNQYISKRANQETFYYRTFVADNPSTMGTFDNNYYARPLDDNRTIHCDFYQSGGSGTHYLTLEQWRSNYSLDANSKKAPLTYKTNIDDSIRLEYNASAEPKVVPLDANYVDVKNTSYSGFVELAPFSGVVLFKTRVSTKANQTITFPALSAKTFGNAPFGISATASSGLPVSFRIVSGPATLNGSTVTITGAGTVTVEATQAGNTSFNAAPPVTRSFTVNKAAQTISFTAIGNRSFSSTPFALTATSTSGLPVSFRIASGPATISGNMLTMTGSGTVTVEADQAGDGNYNAAASVTQSFTISSTTVVKQNQVISFGSLPARAYGDASFTLNATASSGLPVSYRVVSGPVTISGNTVSINGTGWVIIEATQSGNTTYNAATAVSQGFSVVKGNQTISFADLADKDENDGPFGVSATATSGLPVSFRVVSGPAFVNGNVVTLTGSGFVTIEAVQPGDVNYNAATPVTQSFTVASNAAKKNQTISFSSIGYKTYVSPDFTLVASATSNLPVSFRVVSGPVRIVGNAVQIEGVGSVIIEATQQGNESFNPASPVQRIFTVGKAGQFITFPNPTNKLLGDLPFALAARSSSGLPVSYKVVSGPASVLGNIVTLLGTGNVTIEATQLGDDNFSAAYPLQRTFSVTGSTTSRSSQTINFPAIANKTYGDEPFELQGTATSGLEVSYRVVSGPASITDNVVIVNGAGTVTIEASQEGDDLFFAAAAVNRSFTVAKAAQFISFGDLQDMSLSESPFELNASASSGLPVAFRVVSGPATINGNTIRLTGVGTVIVEASQSGDENYLAAGTIRQSFNAVNTVKQEQTISFGTLGYKTYTSPDFALNATASSGLPVYFRVVSGPVIINNGNIVSVTGVGQVTIEAFQTGNAAYIAAEPVQRSFTVGKAGQFISFQHPSSKTVGESFSLTATASSGLPVSYRIVSGPAIIDDNVVIPTGEGTVTIEASQPGDEFFSAAYSLQRSFSVVSNNNLLTSSGPQRSSVETPTALNVPKASLNVYPNPVVGSAQISVSVPQTLTATLEVVDLQGKVVKRFSNRRLEKGQLNTIRLDAGNLNNGMYIVRLVAGTVVISQKFQVVK